MTDIHGGQCTTTHTDIYIPTAKPKSTLFLSLKFKTIQYAYNSQYGCVDSLCKSNECMIWDCQHSHIFSLHKKGTQCNQPRQTIWLVLFISEGLGWNTGRGGEGNRIFYSWCNFDQIIVSGGHLSAQPGANYLTFLSLLHPSVARTTTTTTIAALCSLFVPQGPNWHLCPIISCKTPWTKQPTLKKIFLIHEIWVLKNYPTQCFKPVFDNSEGNAIWSFDNLIVL